jgi:hypothetical protein
VTTALETEREEIEAVGPGLKGGLTTAEAARLLGIPLQALHALLNNHRELFEVRRSEGRLLWTAQDLGTALTLLRRRELRPKPDGKLSLPVLLFSSRKLGVTARLVGLDLQAQGAHQRDAVARLRRHLLLRYQELAAQPLQEPDLWAGLQAIIAPRGRQPKEPADV